MPSTTIEIRRPCEPSVEIAIMDAVHAALVAAFQIPEDDRGVRLVVHEPHRFQVRPGLAHPELATVVNVDAFAGRSTAAKRALYRAVVENLEPLGVPADHVTVLVRDLPPESWGIRGGQAACDVDLGFAVDV